MIMDEPHMPKKRGPKPLTESQELNGVGLQRRPGPNWWRVRHYHYRGKFRPEVHVDRLDLSMDSVEEEVEYQEVTLASLEFMGGTDGRGYIEEQE